MDYYERFCEDLKLRGYAERSRKSYRRAVRQLQQFCCKPLPEITEKDVRGYWLCCKDDFQWSPATLRISYSGIKHFFTYTIKRDWPLFSEFKLERSESLPVVLSIDEVRTILNAFPEGQNRTFFETVYSLGLRLTEALTLQVRDIDSDRMLVHVHAGKGAQDRMVPLPQTTLYALRRYWKTHRNPTWIFPALGRDGKGGATAKKPASDATVQGALRRVCKNLAFRKHVRTHSFRHSYATHLIEAGVPVRHVQEYLGHKTLTSTMIYLHLTTAGKEQSRSRIDQLMRGVSS
jgi:site-specific recombinase XerD